MQPTTKDLARAAGVSLASVDRVLNNRENVSARAREQVNAAIEKVGFVRNSAAVNLAKGRYYRLRLLLPDDGDQYLAQIIEQVRATQDIARQDLTIIDFVQIDMRDPHLVARYLTDPGPADLDGLAIMAPTSPQVRDATTRLNDRGIRTVQFLAGQKDRNAQEFVGADNLAAGRTAARIIGSFSGGQKGLVLVVAETMRSLASIERRLGIDEVLGTHFPDLNALPSLETRGRSDRAEEIIATFMAQQRDVVAVYALGSEARVAITAVSRNSQVRKMTIVAHERTPFTELALREGVLDAVIAQDPGHAVRSAVRILCAQIDGRVPFAAQEKIRNEVLFFENL